MNIYDNISPELMYRVHKLQDKLPILTVAAEAVKSIAERSWDEPALRLAPWPNKADGSKATLRGPDGVLVRSLTIQPEGADAIAVGSDRPYACAQNFGYPRRNLPARPYFPITTGGEASAAVREAIEDAVATRLKKLLE